MRSCTQLPEGYREIRTVDLQKDKKTSFWVNAAASAAMVVLAVFGHVFLVPISEMFRLGPGPGMGDLPLKAAVMIVGMLAYIVLHELTHAAAMRLFGAKRIRFGFTGLYAFAGSEEDYFDRIAYVTVALAPVVVWTVIFGILSALVPRSWFWVVYVLQLSNLSGAAGDLYVSFLTLRMAKSVLTRDTGVSMTFYDCSPLQPE